MTLVDNAAFEQKLVVLAEYRPAQGWSVTLECGHQTTFKTHPGERSFCRECIAEHLQQLKLTAAPRSTA